MNIWKVIGSIATLAPGICAAQEIPVRNYLTYSDAINGIITPGRSLSGCSGFDQDGDDIYFDADNANQDPPILPDGFGSLSPALQRQCEKSDNGIGGVTLGGGLGGPFTTRTFLPFIVDTARPTPPEPAATSRNLATNGLFIQKSSLFSKGGLTFNFSGSIVETETTDFGAGQEGGGYQLSVGRVSKEANDRAFGYFLTLEGESTSSGDLFDFSGVTLARQDRVTDPIDALEAAQRTLDRAEALCDGLGPAKRRNKGLGLTAFATQPSVASGKITMQASLSYAKSNYSSPTCLYRLGEDERLSEDRFFAGTIKGDSSRTSLDFAASYQTQGRVLSGSIIPRVGFATRLTYTPGFTETELSVPTGTEITAESSVATDQIPAEDTGLALTYDDDLNFSATAELGATFVWPVQRPNATGAITLDFAYLHTLSEDRTITAKFAGDGRPTPTNFSFQRGPVDRDVFTVGIGYTTVNDAGLISSFGASALLGDRFEDRYTIGASFQRTF